ncbi:high-affinity branched-chain amino acid transport ATP-binding protein LivF [Variibacter gotjawalensis]|uniref:High-affinity branched-chain amino acid transport ATP-binding protein LivF n=1 Tax=Variibacter gotjawalensis TaxID=1333996 RepID=A0A0S3Q145_9BRAD|nr:ABC transporter ATP-binding protein [Variibacter gotjawalensis]NIK47776.1 branched-chain amino acid transport system ATP-binding protein [Variibacter gotjawalensis]RZS49663.1 amino acid/amide ABC transporter ATP-binding protein 2 (HAAT family) [Variibacter gotjawalensis]BAT61929.1 high-affinity branched-chain amino acid transport ATP-binding protein LivF [Variibacter gotjawalensis]
MLKLENIVSRYGRIEVLHGVSLNVNAGEIVTLVGSNGAGKTTLLRVISGVQPRAAGEITFEGKSIARMPPHARVAAGIAQVPEGRQVFAPLSIEDNLRLGAWTRSDDVAREIDDIYAMFPILKEKRALPAGALSGGQQQMLAMGRALMSKPKLLLLDEPSMGLAPLLIDQIMRAIVSLRERGVTLLLVEQNVTAALEIADRAYVIETGKIVLDGEARTLAKDDRVRAAYLGI